MAGDRHREVADWVRAAYGCGKCEVLAERERTVGALFRLRTDHRVMWLRVDGVMNRSVDEMEAEGAALAHLIDRGLAVHTPRRRADGDFSGAMHLSDCAGPAIAYAEVPSEASARDQPRAKLWGQALRNLHDTPVSEHDAPVSGDAARPPAARRPAARLPTVEPLVKVQERLDLVNPCLDARQKRDLEAIIQPRAEQAATLKDRVLCHGDARLTNVLFTANRAVLIDTEALGLGPRMYDLACVWRSLAVDNELRAVHEDWAWFREGYEASGELPPAAWQQINALACLRALWTMALPVETSQRWGKSWRTDPSYWNAHMEHIRWFAQNDP